MQLWLSCHYSLFEVFGAVAVQEDSISHDDDADQDGKLLVDWVVKKDGGMVSDKLELRKVKRGLGGYDFGMFATQDFVKDEVVMTIPLSCMVSSTKRYKKNSNKDDSVPQTTLERECQTVHNMVFEYQKGNNSDYYPYMKYIFEGHGNLWGETLKTWSEEGKRVLFDTVIDTELAPQRVFVEQFSYDNDCEPSPQDNEKPDQSVDAETRHLSEQAYVYFLARSRGDSIVPLYDMIPHRNGHWRNVDAEMIPEKRVISVYAHRDIQKGEQLYTSMNECDHLGCEDLEDTYLTQHLFSHFGVLEDYPRRWLLEADPEMDDMDMIIDLDQRREPDGSKKLFLHWRTPLPDPYQINWIHAHLQRLHRINQTVYEEAATLDAPHERDTTIQYYEAYKEIFQAAWDNRKGDTLDEAESANKREYDSLQYSKSDAVIPYESYAVCTRSISQDVQAGRKEIGLDQSHYQPIRFSYTEGIDVTTLTLNGWVQTATNFRPHYHEPVVHAAAQYMKKVKRIIFLGGGDNMLLHEMMKYKDLELVVGIELDQMVSRLSFKHFGNSPFFDDPRIQWWFGDASKAINVLPDDYFGSFDIVIVDLLTYIADTVKVKGSLSIMDAAALLMKQEGGVILRNEDFSIRSNTAFAKYTVDLDFLDMPYLCEQSITMGSNSIDFLKAETVDHGVEVLVRPLFFPNKNDAQNGVPFDGWNKYRNKRQQTCEAVNDDLLDKDEGDHCDEDTQNGPYGVMTIIEAENASSASKTIPEIQAEVTSVANKFGLKDGSLVVSESSPNVFILVHDEGYITTRVYKDERYIAFDVAIWEDFNRVDAFNDDLVAAVGGSVQKSTTSLKVVTGGMPVRRDVCRNSYLATFVIER
jgi:spermidine synthase